MMEFWLIESLGISLVLTLLLEGLFSLAIGIRNKRDLLLICLVNLITNPIVVLLYHLATLYTELNVVTVIILLELIAIAVEAKYYKDYGKHIVHPYIFAVSVNLFSFSVGAIINY